MTAVLLSAHFGSTGREMRLEIWERVVWFLQREVPGPLTRPDRRDIRQGDLVAAMKTCSTLYDLAAPLLYFSVVSDNLTALLYVHPPRSCSPRLAGKSLLLHRIKHLYLENTDKSHIPMGDDQASNDAYYNELASLHGALTSTAFAIPHGPFPNLETLALGSIYGPPDPISWDTFCRTGVNASRGRMMRELSDAMPRLLLAPRLQGVCQRGGGGLLNFPALMEHPPSTLSSTPLTTHIQPGEEYWTLPLGRPCRWVLDTSHTFSSIRENVKSVLNLTSSMRPWSPTPVDQRIMLDIYATGTDAADGFNRRLEENLPPGWRWEGSNAAYWDCLEAKDAGEVIKDILDDMCGVGVGNEEVRWLPRRKAAKCGGCER